MLKSFPLLMAVVVGLFASPTAAIGRDLVAHKLSNEDTLAIDRKSDDFFALLKQGQPENAVKNLLGTTGLMEGKKSELTQLSNQIASSLDIYGPISDCLLVQRDGRGGVVEEQQFICTHSKLASRWKLLFIKTANGWIAGNLYFDDRVMAEKEP